MTPEKQPTMSRREFMFKSLSVLIAGLNAHEVRVHGANTVAETQKFFQDPEQPTDATFELEKVFLSMIGIYASYSALKLSDDI